MHELILTNLARFRQVALVISLLCALVIGMGATRVTVSKEVFAGVSSVFLVVCALPSCVGWIRARGVGQGVATLLVLALYAITVEATALRFGFPYGSFEYLGAMPGVLPGGVPWAVPFAWVPLMLSAFALAQRVTSSAWGRWLAAVIVLVVMDLVLDPGAVALGIWRYVAAGWWYEVPWTNFAGWCLTGGLVFIPMRRIQLTLPVWMRAGTWMLLAFWTGVALISEFWGVVLVAMGLCVLEVRLAMDDSSRQ